MHAYQGQTADEIWVKAYQDVTNPDLALTQPSRIGNTSELLHAQFSISDPRQRWVLSRKPAINPAFAIAEFFWIMGGKNEAQFINKWFPGLGNFQGKTESYHGAYGHRIRRNFEFDQMDRAYHVLSNQPNTRQVVIQIWDTRKDFPFEDGSSRSHDIPCNISSMPKVRNGRLEWMQIMRSNDLFRGTPYNIVQFTMLQEVLAGWLGVEVGSYNQLSDSLHVYENDTVFIDTKEVTGGIENEDDLRLPRQEFDRVFSACENILDRLAMKKAREEAFISEISNIDLPIGYKNLVVIALADIARRRKWTDGMNAAAKECSNKALLKLWGNWLQRNSRN